MHLVNDRTSKLKEANMVRLRGYIIVSELFLLYTYLFTINNIFKLFDYF